MGYSARSTTGDAYVVEIDGRIDSEYRSITAALNAGLTAKHANGAREVRVHEALNGKKAEPVFHWWMMLDEASADAPAEFHWG